MNFSLWKKVAEQVSKGKEVSKTSLTGLNRKEFVDNGQKLVAIEQNPRTGSIWAAKARQGQKVVQFKDATTNEYVGVSVDGRVTKY